ncbi:ATP-grasp domain-containing protein [Motilibacter aurantiacus]|uniref:ATP-grasp domain-containing protein n=1 Tax=Motilibacter aurantiacus TaxID=2714955 RepID=UPI00140A9894|nr:hypothetical protein [Motilibacter aurantiacus]NHC47465.1 hypothetical protein [Motilibacter aurantiacus]
MDIVLVTGSDMPKPDAEVPLLVDALTARGLDVVVRAWNQAGQDGTSWDPAPLVVVKSPWDYFDDRAGFVRWAHEVAGRATLVNPAQVLEWNSHKGYLLDLQQAGVAVLETVLVRRGAGEGERAAALDRLGGEVVIKPAVGGGAWGALRTPAGAEAAAGHLRALAADEDVLVQRFDPSVLSAGEASLIYFGGRFSHAIRKVPAAGDYRVQEFYGGRVLTHEPGEAELAAAAAALGVAPGAGLAYARVDLVRLDGEPAVMELELIEPELFLPHAPGSVERYADVLVGLLPAG